MTAAALKHGQVSVNCPSLEIFDRLPHLLLEICKEMCFDGSAQVALGFSGG